MDLILEDDGSGSYTNAPQAFKDALTYAADYLDNLITNDITVTIEVGYGTFEGKAFGSNVFAEGGPEAGENVSYANLVTDLNHSANSADDTTAYGNLPAQSPYGDTTYYLSPAQQKAFGLLSANSSEVDGAVGFATEQNGDFNYSITDRAMPNEYDFVGVALHELTHALGRIADFVIGGDPTILDLFRYSAPGVIDTSGRIHAQDYFSIDGGTTNLDNFDATGSDPGDWGVNSGAAADDANNAYVDPDVVNAFTQTDIAEMDVLGFNVNPSATVALTALSVTAAPGRGDFGSGAQITFTVTFSGNATVTGAPVLTLNDDGTATYQNGSGTDELTFLYTVGASDLSETALAVTGIDQTNGTVTDSSNNAADFADLPTTFSGLEISPLVSTVFTWSSLGGGDWNTATDWAPSGVPVASSTARILLAGTVTSSHDNSVAILTMAKTATLAVTSGTFAITGGTGAGSAALAGTIAVSDGASLALGPASPSASFNNTGSITLNSTGETTDLIVAGTVALHGKGKLILSDNSENNIVSNGSSATLENASTISGAGTIGDADLSFDNQAKGVIDATGTHALTVDLSTLSNQGKIETGGTGGLLLDGTTVDGTTPSSSVVTLAAGAHIDLEGATISGGKVSSVKGSTIDTLNGQTGTIAATVSNAGTLEADNGNLTVDGKVTNNGALAAVGYTLTIDGAVSGNGTATISSGGTIEFGATDSKIKQKVTFANDDASTETLKFDAAATGTASLIYDGTISGFTGTNDFIDFDGLTFVTGTDAVTTKASGADTLVTVTEGADAVSFKLVGSYTAGNFTVSQDSGTGTEIVDPPVAGAPVAQQNNLFIQAIASFAAGSHTAHFVAAASHDDWTASTILAANSQH